MGISSLLEHPSLFEQMQYVVFIAVAIGAFIGGIIIGVKRGNGNSPISKYDLSVAIIAMEERASKSRHDIYNKMEQHYASLVIDIKAVEDNVAEYVKVVEQRIREQQEEMTKIKVKQAEQNRDEIYRRGTKS